MNSKARKEAARHAKLVAKKAAEGKVVTDAETHRMREVVSAMGGLHIKDVPEGGEELVRHHRMLLSNNFCVLDHETMSTTEMGAYCIEEDGHKDGHFGTFISVGFKAESSTFVKGGNPADVRKAKLTLASQLANDVSQLGNSDPRWHAMRALVMDVNGQYLKNRSVSRRIEADGARLTSMTDAEQNERRTNFLRTHDQH